MAVDFDKLVIGPCTAIFGDPVTYSPAAGDPPFAITGVYNDAYVEVETTGDGPPVTSSYPVLGVQLSQFAALGRATPVQGDGLTLDKTGESFDVREVRPDGKGAALLLLNSRGTP